MKNSRSNIRWLTQLALLVAIMLVMSYTPLGYLPLGPLNCSLLSIPVAIGAMTMGPSAGAILGSVFGVTSFMNAVEGKSALGAALFAASPIGYFVTAVVGRILMGWLCALVFKAVQKLLPGKEKTTCAIGGFAAPFLNTVFYMGFMVLLFYRTDYIQGLVAAKGATNPFMFIVLMVGVQGTLEWILGCVIGGAVTVPLRKFLKKSNA
ncbi:ECF transporter S component [bacterium]|nr:ECF transporter S component [bacterium]